MIIFFLHLLIQFLKMLVLNTSIVHGNKALFVLLVYYVFFFLFCNNIYIYIYIYIYFFFLSLPTLA